MAHVLQNHFANQWLETIQNRRINLKKQQIDSVILFPTHLLILCFSSRLHYPIGSIQKPLSFVKRKFPFYPNLFQKFGTRLNNLSNHYDRHELLVRMWKSDDDFHVFVYFKKEKRREKENEQFVYPKIDKNKKTKNYLQ